ncbi:MAG: glycine betaine/L-proline ABC transporter permease ProW [Thiothrix sp.]|nr:glycine betaine/L-proline ABC transporter permease ProW [Thiothrix sp.]HPQ94501.1 glycine betaine/L-proline ABC transporter permease ProW [Thiolinea sp.]
MADNASNPAAAGGTDQAAQSGAPAAGNAWTAPAADTADTSSNADWLSGAPDVTPDSFNWLDPFQEAVIPLDAWVNSGLTWVVDHLRPFFQAIRWPIDATLTGIQAGLQAVPAPVLILLIALLAWQVSGRRLALGSILSLIFVGLIGAWDESVITLALVITAVFFSLLIGLPTGIWLSRSDQAASTLRPFLDAMQTTPAFVYLVPIVMLFGIGNVPGVVVTIIFALPPLIRLTNLGIRQVPEDLVEATRSFGASPRQLLFKVQLPLAMPTILAGINQTLMLALSMVVIASMIAVGGLGQMVLRGIGRLDMGLATVGGIGIVVLAIILDRITQSMGRDARSRGTRHWYDTGPIGWVVRQFGK